MTNDVNHLFCFYWPFVYPSCEVTISIVCPLLEISLSSFYWVVRTLYILYTSFLSDKCIANKNSFTFLFLEFTCHNFFFLPHCVAITSSTLLNRGGESGCLDLVPILQGRAVSFSSLGILLQFCCCSCPSSSWRWFLTVFGLYSIYLVDK